MWTSRDPVTSAPRDARTFSSEGSADRIATPPGASTPYRPADPDRTWRPEMPGTKANHPDDEYRSAAGVGTDGSRRWVTAGRPAQELPSPRSIAMRSARMALL